MRVALFCLPILFPVAAGAWLLVADRHGASAHGDAERGHGSSEQAEKDESPPIHGEPGQSGPATDHPPAEASGHEKAAAAVDEDSHAAAGAAHSDAGPAEEKSSPSDARAASESDHAKAAPQKAPAHHEMTEAEDVWTTLLEGNQRFLDGKPARRDLVSLRKALSKGQHPKVIVLGCADSRVSPSLVFDQTLGELFEVRVAGNIADPAAIGSIEYAVEHLNAEVLLVLGHEKCGAVAAAAAGGHLPTANLEAIVRKISPAIDDLESKETGEALLRQCEEANVRRSARDLIRSSPIIRKHLEEGKLTIFLAVYKLATGEVKRLE